MSFKKLSLAFLFFLTLFVLVFLSSAGIQKKMKIQSQHLKRGLENTNKPAFLIAEDSSRQKSEKKKENNKDTYENNTNTEENESLENTNKSAGPSDKKIKELNKFFEKNAALDIHNYALQLLQKEHAGEEKIKALLLLKRNFYQNLFPPSYVALVKNQEPVFLLPFFTLSALLILTAAFLFGLIFKIKSKQNFSLRVYGAFLIMTAFLLGGAWLFKSRLAFLEDKSAHSLPFDEVAARKKIKAGEELILLEERSGWLLLKKENQEKVWLPKKEPYFELF